MHCQYCQEAHQTYQGKLAAIKYCITLYNQKEKINFDLWSKSFRRKIDNEIYKNKLDNPVHIQYTILVKIKSRQEFVYLVVFTCLLTMIMPVIAFLDPVITSTCQSSSSQRQKECLKMTSLCWQPNMAQLIFGYMVKLLQKNSQNSFITVYKNL